MQAELEELKALWLDLRAHVDRLADERQHYLDFFEQATEAYVVTDANGTIVDVNGAAVDILQRRRLYLRGKPLASLVALERRRDFRERLRALAAGEPAQTRAWGTILEAPGLRTDVTLVARRIEREGRFAGLCWRLEALQ
jgi:PAS domain S-box-containing protein